MRLLYCCMRLSNAGSSSRVNDEFSRPKLCCSYNANCLNRTGLTALGEFENSLKDSNNIIIYY